MPTPSMPPSSGRFSSSIHRGEGDEKNPRGTEAKRSRAGVAGNAGRRPKNPTAGHALRGCFYTKSLLLLDFGRGAQRVSPVCCGLLLWFRWRGCEKVDQSPHGRDGHAPLFFRCKVQFQRDNGITPPLAPSPHAEALRAELQSAMTALEEVLAKDFRTEAAR